MTIADGDDFHIYQEIFENNVVYLKIDKHGGTVEIKNNSVSVNLPPELLTQIAIAWLSNLDKYDPKNNL
jgi:hypothetical protein